MRKRISALIIENKKILLSRDKDLKFYSLPGGALDIGESIQQALSREIKEELNVPIIKSHYYSSYTSFNERLNIRQIDYNYLISINGTPSPSNEIAEIYWFNKEEFQLHPQMFFSPFLKEVLPKLLEDSLL
ncbi:MAG: NUDIX domain-containing protein [Nanoarchaeota archaeon]|nr:NUDIX domain-containing protein [Nanoarchaeota archaeon]